jgi:hypothetical protein
VLLTVTPHTPGDVETTAGEPCVPTQVSMGAGDGVTVTKNVVCELLLWESVAVHLTVVAPTGNTLPDPGVHTGVTGPST